jgi:hypothetical protein
MDGRAGAHELDTTHWAADRNSNDNHGLVQRPAEEKALRSFVRGQFLFFLVREKHTRIDLKNRRAHFSTRAKILTFVSAWVLASAVPDALGYSPSTQSGTVPDLVVENRACRARHKLPSWRIVGHAEEVRRCIALARPPPCHNTLDSDPPWS